MNFHVTLSGLPYVISIWVNKRDEDNRTVVGLGFIYIYIYIHILDHLD